MQTYASLGSPMHRRQTDAVGAAAHGAQPDSRLLLSFITYQIVSVFIGLMALSTTYSRVCIDNTIDNT